MSSLKSLYQRNRDGSTVSKYLKASAPNTLGGGIESGEHLTALKKRQEYFLPPVDYSDPENFVKFGSAYEYYKNTFSYISSYYPYDGSGYEKTKFYNDINPLEKYMLEVVYPRSTGYVTVGYPYGTLYVNDTSYYSSSLDQYIQIKGGPHKNTKFDINTDRTSNLEFGGPSGSTIEFFLKKDELIDSGSESPRQVIFDLTNGVTDSSREDYGRFRIELVSGSETQFNVTMLSGNNGYENVLVPTTTDQITISDGVWRNFGFVFDTSNNIGRLDFYVNGTCIETDIASNGAGAKLVSEVTGTLIANMGALRADTKATTGLTEGAGKLSASLDEFRFWKTARNGEQIGRHWLSNVEGGSDKYDANVSLGAYYKFNEGLTLTSSIDQVVLDYSGRLSNGLFTGYSATYSRNTGSAIDSLNLTSVSERGDPIIRKSNPSYVSTKAEYELSGTHYDVNNTARLMNNLPSWVIEEGEAGPNEIVNLTQIMASYFDTLYNQLTALKELKYNKYVSGSLSTSIDEFPYNDRLVENFGIQTPEIFENIGTLGQFFQRDEQINFDQQLVDIKNSIYKNLYNNLNYILKSKGNPKAIRNFIRCLGVGEEVLALNTYANNSDYELSSSYLTSVSSKKFTDFTGMASLGDSEATVYQYYDSSISSSVGQIAGSTGLTEYALTLQGELLFPNKDNYQLLSYDLPSVISASLFGFHTPSVTTPTSTDLSWAPSATDYGLQIYAVRSPAEYAEVVSPANEVKDAYFVVKNRDDETLLTSDIYKNIYNNEKWNLALTLKPKKYPFSDGVSGSSVIESGYELGLYGANYNTGIKINSFNSVVDISYTSGSNIINSAKRIYAGAHRTNCTGTVLELSDVKASSIRYWTNYLTSSVIDSHAREVESHGTLHPIRNSFVFQTGSLDVYIPQAQTLALNWDFDTVTGSNASGRFFVPDASSGSMGDVYQGNYQGSELSSINLRSHTGRGDYFVANSTPVRKEYVYMGKLLPPEYMATTEMINVLSSDDEVFGTFKKPANSYFAIEKSMYRSISNRMLQLFASIDEYNNLLGEPVNKYRINYKKMEKLREIFFRRVQNDIPDLQKYLDYYKWLDSAMGGMIEQLMPASARYAPSVRNVVESHSLERNKIQHKYPILKDSRSLKYKYSGGIGASIGGANTPLGFAGDPHNSTEIPPDEPRNPNNNEPVEPEDVPGIQAERPPQPQQQGGPQVQGQPAGVESRDDGIPIGFGG